LRAPGSSEAGVELAHASDLDSLVGLDVVGEHADLRLGAAARLAEFLDHRERAQMVEGHEAQEQAVEAPPVGVIELPELA
jgi:hypothetical protein